MHARRIPRELSDRELIHGGVLRRSPRADALLRALKNRSPGRSSGKRYAHADNSPQLKSRSLELDRILETRYVFESEENGEEEEMRRPGASGGEARGREWVARASVVEDASGTEDATVETYRLPPCSSSFGGGRGWLPPPRTSERLLESPIERLRSMFSMAVWGRGRALARVAERQGRAPVEFVDMLFEVAEERRLLS